MNTTFAYLGGSEGSIRPFRLNIEDGATTSASNPVDAAPNPSFLTVTPKKQRLYAESEINDDRSSGAEHSHMIVPFWIDQETGQSTCHQRRDTGAVVRLRGVSDRDRSVSAPPPGV